MKNHINKKDKSGRTIVRRVPANEVGETLLTYRQKGIYVSKNEKENVTTISSIQHDGAEPVTIMVESYSKINY